METCSNCLKIDKGMDADIRLNDDFVSKLHAVIHFEEERFFISEPGSDSGLYLGEKRIRREKPEDVILLKLQVLNAWKKHWSCK